MEEILKSILQTEQEAEKVIAGAKAAAQVIAQDAGVQAERITTEGAKTLREKVQAHLSGVRQEAAGMKEVILKEAQSQAQALERKAQDHMPKAVEAALNRLLAET